MTTSSGDGMIFGEQYSSDFKVGYAEGLAAGRLECSEKHAFLEQEDDVRRAFYALTVGQRDAAWREIESLKQRLRYLREEIGARRDR